MNLTTGGRLGVSSAQSFGTTQRLTVELTDLAGLPYDPQRHRFEWVEPGGKRHVASAAYLGQRLAVRAAPADDLYLLGGGPGLPWGALGWLAATRRPGANVQGGIDFILRAAPPAGSKLVLVELDTKKVEVPFEFRDLPLP